MNDSHLPDLGVEAGTLLYSHGRVNLHMATQWDNLPQHLQHQNVAREDHAALMSYVHYVPASKLEEAQNRIWELESQLEKKGSE